MLDLRSNLKEPRDAVLHGGDGRESGEQQVLERRGREQDRGTQCDGRAGGSEELVRGCHPTPNARVRDMGTKFVKVKLS